MKNIKQIIVIPITICTAAFILTGIGRFVLEKFDLNGIYDNFILYKSIKIVTGISNILFVAGVIYFIIFGLYYLYKHDDFRSKVLKIMACVAATAVGIGLIAALVVAAAFNVRSNFGRIELDITERWAFIEFLVTTDDTDKTEGYADFSKTTYFKWDTLYVFANDFNQDELSEYVGGEIYKQIQPGFEKIRNEKYPQDGTMFFFFKDGIMILADCADMTLCETEDKTETEFGGFNLEVTYDIIYFREFNSENAAFYSFGSDNIYGDLWAVYNDIEE